MCEIWKHPAGIQWRNIIRRIYFSRLRFFTSWVEHWTLPFLIPCACPAPAQYVSVGSTWLFNMSLVVRDIVVSVVSSISRPTVHATSVHPPRRHPAWWCPDIAAPAELPPGYLSPPQNDPGHPPYNCGHVPHNSNRLFAYRHVYIQCYSPSAT